MRENDFVKDEVIDLEVKGFKKGDWKYKPMTAEAENNALNTYMKIDENGKLQQDLGELNWLKISNIVDAPYNKDLIKKVINVEKDWKKLSYKQKKELIGKLKPSVFSNLISSIQKIDNTSDEVGE